jgi:Reverse transcriptase (RNA-dependent DNA polymerase)
LPARRVYIPKPGAPAGEQRPLSIPAVRDRVVQAAVKIVLEPVFEADFLPCSFGFRPGRSQQDALQVLVEECAGPPVGGRDGHRGLLFRDSASGIDASGRGTCL